MAVKRKPQNVEEFIQGGGSEPPHELGKEKQKQAFQPLKLRVRLDLMEEIDEAVSSRRPKPSRHQWILEAIYEKLDRENSKAKG